MNTGPHQTGKPMYGWYELPWKKFERRVFKLQKRIYRAEYLTYIEEEQDQ